MKLIGVDYGRRRIGIAATDPDGIVVRGLDTIDTCTVADPLAAVLRVIESEHPERIVVGLPLDRDDNETMMSREAREFAARLGERTGISIEFIDESFSSHQAHALLRTRRRKHRRNKASVDRMAACLLLEAYLRTLGT
jgi:putative holliday junction resolvase